jgi:hypothetical protein
MYRYTDACYGAHRKEAVLRRVAMHVAIHADARIHAVMLIMGHTAMWSVT